MAALALHKRPFDLFVVVFLLVHIPVTLFVDSQAGKSARLPCLASSDMHEAKVSMGGRECVPATTCDIYIWSSFLCSLAKRLVSQAGCQPPRRIC